MKKKLATWQLIKDSLEEGLAVMLLYVLQSSGSSPGRSGFYMAVTGDGKMEGSIGGGMMEHKLVELARDKLKAVSGEPQIRKQIHNKSAAKDQSGMICSGEQTVLLYPVQQKDRESIEQIISCLRERGSGTLLLSPQSIGFLGESPKNKISFDYHNEESWLYKEIVGHQNHLYIVGGGHCALALSRLMSELDFYIHLYDVRQDLLTMVKNDAVHEKKVIADYNELSSLIPTGNSVYVVVMTFGYRTDDIAIRALLNKEVKYFGVLGSRAKIEKMFDDYQKEGIDQHLIRRIYAPVGLPILSQTPEEIAVSIAAEIIQVKNGESQD
jgi:xanthine dehydrogenase accessory factor